MKISTGANVSLDMNELAYDVGDIGYADVTSFTSTAITGYVGSIRVVIKGVGFTTKGGYLAGGTITGVEETYGGTKYFSMSGLKLSVPQLIKVLKTDTITDDIALIKAALGGADSIKGSDLADVLNGYGGNDTLSGGKGDDKVYGGAGNDTVVGGAGADDLWGGSGKDTFLYNSASHSKVAASGRDTIFDFKASEGDRINLSPIDANSKTAKNDAFSWLGTKAFSGKAGELRYEKQASDTYIYGDTNGDRKADFAIHLDDAVALQKGYFVL